MSDDWKSSLERWRAAGLMDSATAESIRSWEAEHVGANRNRLAVIVFGLGGLLLVAGVLLFVASNWQSLSPAGRLLLLTATVALFHMAGALTPDSKPALSTTLHAAGTGSLGGAIFLSGQTFHLAENWPEGFFLWAIGAGAGLYLLRDWVHVLFVAILVPLWLSTKAISLAQFQDEFFVQRAATSFFLLTAISYLFAGVPGKDAAWRKALSRLGAATLIPAAILLGVSGFLSSSDEASNGAGSLEVLVWIVAVGVPAGAAYLLRGRNAIFLGVAVLWVGLLGMLDPASQIQRLAIIGLYAVGSVGVALWGLRDRKKLPVNMGVIGFALSVLVFYFASDLFTKLGRSVGLVGAGLLFLGGGWFLDRTRRTIIGKMEGAIP